MSYIGGHTIDVIIKDNEIRIEDEVEAEIINFNVSNQGSVPHNFHIYGNGIDKKFNAPLAPGESGMLELKLPAGTYQIDISPDKSTILKVIS
jgi:uncharacterized cupredoxin-like copper-binding protein